MPEEQCPFHRPLIAPQSRGFREAAAPGRPRVLLGEARVWGRPERSGAGRLMSRVEEARRGPAPSLRPRPGRSGRGLGAGWGWRRLLPHLLAGGEARGPGASRTAPSSLSDSCKGAKHAPRQPHPFRLFQQPLKLSLKTWGAPRRSRASPRRSRQPGEGARKTDLGGAGGRGDTGRGAPDPRDPSPLALAAALRASEHTDTTPSGEALHLVGARAMPIPKARRRASGRKK